MKKIFFGLSMYFFCVNSGYAQKDCYFHKDVLLKMIVVYDKNQPPSSGKVYYAKDPFFLCLSVYEVTTHKGKNTVYFKFSPEGWLQGNAIYEKNMIDERYMMTWGEYKRLKKTALVYVDKHDLAKLEDVVLIKNNSPFEYIQFGSQLGDDVKAKRLSDNTYHLQFKTEEMYGYSTPDQKVMLKGIPEIGAYFFELKEGDDLFLQRLFLDKKTLHIANGWLKKVTFTESFLKSLEAKKN